jgi:hypothetical protein
LNETNGGDERLCMEIRLHPSWKLSSDHAASKGGKPVLVNRDTGKAYGPGEPVKLYPSWKLAHAAPLVRLLAKRAHLDDESAKLVSKFLASWPEGRLGPRARRRRNG